MQHDDYLDWMNIGIRKESETDAICIYRFICNRYRRLDQKRSEDLGVVTGTFKIDKQSGTTEIIEPMQGDEKQGVYVRASQKIKKSWVAGNLPDSEIYCAG